MPPNLGLLGSLALARSGPQPWDRCAHTAAIAGALSCLLLLGLGLEGLICVVMSLPLAMPLALAGAGVGYALQRSFWERRAAPALLVALVLSCPLLMGARVTRGLADPVFAVTTSVEVDAPPAVVWQHVVAFPPLPPPREALFRLGIAYPVSAEIRGHGVGAVRSCRFSTGPFVEPITVWDEPRLLRFAVTENPPPLSELSPYPDLDPPHLHGFLAARQGQFRLVPLPGGRTRLVGTTWYQHGLAPAGYWRLWSDWILHRVHRRVLEHVARLAEGQAAS